MTTWMVVEDEPDVNDMVLAMYATLNVKGVSFSTGEDALDWIEQVESGQYLDDIPELALIDIRLPGNVTGARVGNRLRASSVLGNIVIVLMTAYKLSPSEQEQVMAKAGANMILRKPLPKLQDFGRVLGGLIE